MSAWWLAFKLFRRDIRGGEPRIMALALVLAVTAVAAVGLLNDRLGRALTAEANQLIGADMLVRSDQAITGTQLALARDTGLDYARTAELPTMAFDAGDGSLLVSFKAVETGYPLRGQLLLGDAEQAVVADAVPDLGTAWVAEDVLQALDAKVGDELFVGALTLRIAATIAFEPDRSGGLFSAMPRVMVNYQDLAAAELIAPGSRVRYRLLLAGEEAGLKTFSEQVMETADEASSLRVQRVDQARPEMQTALGRLTRFFSLASLLTVLVAGAAVAIAASSFSRRQADVVALYRSFGASSARILSVTLRWLALLTLAASALGLLLAYLIQGVAGFWVAQALSLSLPSPGLAAPIMGLATALVATLGFALPPLLSLREVPVLRVLRRELSAPSRSAWWLIAAAMLAMALLVVVQAGDLLLAGIVLGAMLVTPGLLYLAATVIIRGLRRLPLGLRPGWLFGLGNFARRGQLSALQAAALSLGVLALALMTLLVQNLLDTWAREVPSDAPNHFVINIQPSQRAEFAQSLEKISGAAPTLYPMMRARVVDDEYADKAPGTGNDSGNWGRRRGFNLTYGDTARDDNETLAGAWWSAEDGAKETLFSVEESALEGLGLALGDTLSFSVGGTSVAGRIVHVRKVRWESLKPNFFVIGSSHGLENLAATWMTAVRLSPDQQPPFNQLLRQTPGVTGLNISEILQRVQRLLDQSAMAVRGVFSFSLFAGILVMLAAVRATRAARAYEVALLRAFGQSRRGLATSIIAEYLTLGTLAGILGCSVAQLANFAISEWIFDLPLRVDLMAWGALVGSAALGTVIAAWLSLSGLISTPPQRVLQAD